MVTNSRNMASSQRQSASIISLAVLIGALFLSLTEAIPIGIDGGIGFVVGFAFGLAALVIIRFAERSGIESKPART